MAPFFVSGLRSAALAVMRTRTRTPASRAAEAGDAGAISEEDWAGQDRAISFFRFSSSLSRNWRVVSQGWSGPIRIARSLVM